MIIADREAVDSCLTGLTLYKTIKDLYPEETQWLPPYRKDTLAGIDRLMGTDKVRRGLDQGKEPAEVISYWERMWRARQSASRTHVLRKRAWSEILSGLGSL